jgi:hypothetical protein
MTTDLAGLASELTVAASDYDAEAAACRAAGGTWSLMLADEHTRAAAQLRAARDALLDPTAEAIRLAEYWRDASRRHLATIRTTA